MAQLQGPVPLQRALRRRPPEFFAFPKETYQWNYTEPEAGPDLQVVVISPLPLNDPGSRHAKPRSCHIGVPDMMTPSETTGLPLPGPSRILRAPASCSPCGTANSACANWAMPEGDAVHAVHAPAGRSHVGTRGNTPGRSLEGYYLFAVRRKAGGDGPRPALCAVLSGDAAPARHSRSASGPGSPCVTVAPAAWGSRLRPAAGGNFGEGIPMRRWLAEYLGTLCLVFTGTGGGGQPGDPRRHHPSRHRPHLWADRAGDDLPLGDISPGRT